MATAQELKKEQSSRPSDAVLLKEIRENYADWMQEWREIREEAKEDMRYISGDPWDPEERRIRENANRPCMAWDELSQYVNQLVNEPKQNKRSVGVSPRGNGANQKTAETRKGLIDEILYNSKAQMAFTTGFQGAVERSYGYWGVSKRYVSGNTEGPEAFNQELYIRRIPNPDSVLFDPNYKELDCSDSMGCFVLDLQRRKDYKRKYPKAKITDFSPFTAESGENYSQWIKERDVLVGEYWRVTIEQRTAHLIEQKEGGHVVLFEDELPGEFDMNLSKRQRRIEKRIVSQFITNGVEILDETEIEIPWIPIVPVFGKELFVDNGAGAQRMLMSLIRLARDPYMAYCYFRSQEAEEAGMTPRVPIIGWKGNFDTAREEWKTLNKVPRAFIELDPVYGQNGEFLPIPEKQPFTPNFQSYEVACEAARRAIMAAVGINPLPTAAQRRNEKSGVALQEIDKQEDEGSFHFIDNYNLALEQTGRILDAWIPFVYDTPREIGVRNKDESRGLIRINDPAYVNKQGKQEELSTTDGDHGVTISVSPSYADLRQEASDFLDKLIENLQSIPAPPPQLAKLLSLAIKQKQMGPLGDEMADIISPPEDEAGRMAQMQNLQGQLQQSQEMIALMQQQIEEFRIKEAGKVVDNQFKVQLKNMETNFQAWQTVVQNDLKAFVAEVTTKAQKDSERLGFLETFIRENHQTGREAAAQARDHVHESNMADKNLAIAQASAAQPDQVSESGDSTNSPQGAGQ